MQFRYRANLPLYRDQYELFGSFELMSAKWNLDIAAYYALWVNSYLQDLHLDVGDLRHELRQSAFVIRALEGFAALFNRAERAVTERGDYEAHNLGRFDEALGDVSFTRDVGRMNRRAAEAQTLAAFGRARARCFGLLNLPVDADEQLGFADFVMGAALQPS